MGSIFHQSPPWVFATVFFTLLSHQVIIPCVVLAATLPRTLRTKNSAILVGGEEDRPHNLIPRFNIPRGNLSYERIPYWEALYFLRYGTPPPRYDDLTDITKVMDYNGLINDSAHNQMRDDIGGPELPSENDIEKLRNKMVESGLENFQFNDNDIDSAFGIFPRQAESKPAISFHRAHFPLLSSGSLGESAAMYVEDKPDLIYQPVRSNLPRQIRFSRGQRTAPPPPLDQNGPNGECSGTTSEEADQISGEKIKRNVWAKRYDKLEKVNRNKDNFEPLGAFGYVRTEGDPRKHYGRDPIHLLRKMLKEEDDGPLPDNAKEDKMHSSTGSRNFGAVNSVFRKNLVPRSGRADGGGESDDDGGTGPRGSKNGGKFQTQGW